MAVPYTFANVPNGSTIPLAQLDANFAYVEGQIGQGITPITNGGTGATTAVGAMTNLLPTQAGNAGKYLTTDGLGNLSWTSSTGVISTSQLNILNGNSTVGSFIGNGAYPGVTLNLPNVQDSFVVNNGSLQIYSGDTGQVGYFVNTDTSSTTYRGLIGGFVNSAIPANGCFAFHFDTASNFTTLDFFNRNWRIGYGSEGTLSSQNNQLDYDGYIKSSGIDLGTSTTLDGTVVLRNNVNSNTLTLKSNVTASSYVFEFPTSAGTSGQVLQTDGLGSTSWLTLGGNLSTQQLDILSGTNVVGSFIGTGSSPGVTLDLPLGGADSFTVNGGSLQVYSPNVGQTSYFCNTDATGSAYRGLVGGFVDTPAPANACFTFHFDVPSNYTTLDFYNRNWRIGNGSEGTLQSENNILTYNGTIVPNAIDMQIAGVSYGTITPTPMASPNPGITLNLPNANDSFTVQGGNLIVSNPNVGQTTYFENISNDPTYRGIHAGFFDDATTPSNAAYALYWSPVATATVYDHFANNTNFGCSGGAGFIKFIGATSIDTVTTLGNTISVPNGVAGTGGTITGTWATVSDASFKDDVTPIPNALDTVKKLNGVSYSWKTDPDKKKNFGYIAQEVQSFLPEVVRTNASDGKLSLAYTEIIPIVSNAVKEIAARLEAAEAKNTELEARIAALEAK